jgi:hypothetical protein
VCVTKLITAEKEDPLEVGGCKTVHYVQGLQFDKVIQQHFKSNYFIENVFLTIFVDSFILYCTN